MKFRVQIRAALGGDHEAVIGVECLNNVESTTPLAPMANRTRVGICFARRTISKSVPAKALTRCFVTTVSSGSVPCAGRCLEKGRRCREDLTAAKSLLRALTSGMPGRKPLEPELLASHVFARTRARWNFAGELFSRLA